MRNASASIDVRTSDTSSLICEIRLPAPRNDTPVTSLTLLPEKWSMWYHTCHDKNIMLAELLMTLAG